MGNRTSVNDSLGYSFGVPVAGKQTAQRIDCTAIARSKSRSEPRITAPQIAKQGNSTRSVRPELLSQNLVFRTPSLSKSSRNSTDSGSESDRSTCDEVNGIVTMRPQEQTVVSPHAPHQRRAAVEEVRQGGTTGSCRYRVPAQRGWGPLPAPSTALTYEELLCSANSAVVTNVTIQSGYLNG